MTIHKTMAAATMTLVLAVPSALAVEQTPKSEAKKTTTTTTTTKTTTTVHNTVKAPVPTKSTDIFMLYDKNHDNKIAKDEWPDQEKWFERLDKNHDGFVTKEEAAKQNRRVDANHDGKITRDEFSGDDAEWAKWDVNKDGAIDEGDRVARLNQQRTARLKGIDKNGDGNVTRSEWPGSDESFKARDRNNDGVISTEELNQPQHQ